MGYSGLAPSPKSRLRGVLAKSLCDSPLHHLQLPLPAMLERRRWRCRAQGERGRRRTLPPFGNVPAGLTVFTIASLLAALSSLDLAAGWICSLRQRGLRCAVASPDLPPARLRCCSRCSGAAREGTTRSCQAAVAPKEEVVAGARRSCTCEWWCWRYRPPPPAVARTDRRPSQLGLDLQILSTPCTSSTMGQHSRLIPGSVRRSFNAPKFEVPRFCLTP